LVRTLTVRGREIDRLKQQFDTIKKALDLLAENRDDAEANLAVGRWRCFVKHDWMSGLPMLVKGSDPLLAKLAEADLADPGGAENQVEMAEQWWNFAKRESNLTRPGIQARARYWWQKALPRLSGLDKTMVENRLKVGKADSTPPISKIRGVVQKGNVALASNGTTVQGVAIRNASKLIDGSTARTSPDKSYPFAFQSWPGDWIITFDKVYKLRQIRVLLFDHKVPRVHNYRIETSVNGKHFTLLVDRTQGRWTSWQIIGFPARPVKVIKFTATNCVGDRNFCMYEMEAYCQPPTSLPR